MGQFIPQYRTDGQYWIDHTKPWACVRKRQSAKTLRAIPEGCARWAHMVGDPAEAVERESRQRRSGSGPKRTLPSWPVMSAVGGKADQSGRPLMSPSGPTPDIASSVEGP